MSRERGFGVHPQGCDKRVERKERSSGTWLCRRTRQFETYTLFFATFVLFNNLLIDLLYAYLDPRIRYQ